LVAIIVCTSNSNENNKVQEKSTSFTNENESTIVITKILDGVATFVGGSTTLRNDCQNFISNQAV